MNFSQIFKYQVHAVNLSLLTPLENLVGIRLVHKSGRKGCCHAILEEENKKKKTREKRALLASAPVHKSGRWEARERVAVMLFYRKKKSKAKSNCMLEIVKSCGNQMLSNLVLKVAVISSHLVYFENGDSRKSEA